MCGELSRSGAFDAKTINYLAIRDWTRELSSCAMHRQETRRDHYLVAERASTSWLA